MGPNRPTRTGADGIPSVSGDRHRNRIPTACHDHGGSRGQRRLLAATGRTRHRACTWPTPPQVASSFPADASNPGLRPTEARRVGQDGPGLWPRDTPRLEVRARGACRDGGGGRKPVPDREERGDSSASDRGRPDSRSASSGRTRSGDAVGPEVRPTKDPHARSGIPFYRHPRGGRSGPCRNPRVLVASMASNRRAGWPKPSIGPWQR